MLTRIRARYLVGYDAATQDHVIYEDAELVFAGDTVLFVGHDYDEQQHGAIERDFDFGESLICPGFIDLNATADFETSDFFLDNRGDPTFALGRNWSEDYLPRAHDLSNAEEEQLKYRFALCKLLANGTTTALPVTGLLHRRWAESRAEFEGLADTASELGLRVYLGPSYRDGVNVTTRAGRLETRWDSEAGRRGLADNVAFIQNLDLANPLLRGALIPSTIETCSEDLLRATRDWADTLNVPLRLHATQSGWEYATIRQRYGRSPVEHLHALGLLGPRLLLPHAIYLAQGEEGDDRALLAKSGSTVLHCPLVIARSGTVMRSLQSFIDRGIRVALATDCCPPDMFMNMRVAQIMGRIVDADARSASTAAVFRSATLAGAEALGRPDLGRLAPGSRADICVVRLDRFHQNAVDDPLRTVLLSASGRDVSQVFVNGRHVLQDGVIPGVDYEALRVWGNRYFRKLKGSYGERDYQQRSLDAFFPPTFPWRRRG